MKVVIAGSRRITSRALVETAIAQAADHGIIPTEVGCGLAAGVDRVGRAWALDHGLVVADFPADWQRHGRSAGMIRNRLMAAWAQAAIIVWDGQSRGTANMLECMRTLGKPVYVQRVVGVDLGDDGQG